MKRLNQAGMLNVLLVPFVLTLVGFIAALSFGVWAYMERGKYKDNAQIVIDKEVALAVERTKTEKDNEFTEREKEPLKDYKGPAAFGSVSIRYPKTWSAYVDESGQSNTPVDGTFHPNFVPGINDKNSYALRLQVDNEAYDQVVREFEGQAEEGEVSVSPFRAKSAPDIPGIRVDGAVINDKRGAMIILPLRDKTLTLWTEADTFVKDFNELILPNLTFIP